MRLGATGLLLALMTLGGCADPGAPRRSTESSSDAQLEAARRSGLPTVLVVEDETLDAKAALARRAGSNPEMTYLVLTRNDAQIVWGRALLDLPPGLERAILGYWVLPHLRKGDRDTALKAMAFGYLDALHAAGRIQWDSAIVPFLPSERPGSPTQRSARWGLLISLLVTLLVVGAARSRP
jgi:hypothetical protein